MIDCQHTLCVSGFVARPQAWGNLSINTCENQALPISQPPSAQGEFWVYEDRTAPIFLVRVVAVVDNQSGEVATFL